MCFHVSHLYFHPVKMIKLSASGNLQELFIYDSIAVRKELHLQRFVQRNSTFGVDMKDKVGSLYGKGHKFKAE